MPLVKNKQSKNKKIRQNACYRFSSILTVANTEAEMEEEEETESDRR